MNEYRILAESTLLVGTGGLPEFGENYTVGDLRWIHGTAQTGTVDITSSQISYDLAEGTSLDGRRLHVVISGENFSKNEDDLPTGGTVTGVLLFDVDGTTLLQSINLASPMDIRDVMPITDVRETVGDLSGIDLNPPDLFAQIMDDLQIASAAIRFTGYALEGIVRSAQTALAILRNAASGENDFYRDQARGAFNEILNQIDQMIDDISFHGFKPFDGGTPGEYNPQFDLHIDLHGWLPWHRDPITIKAVNLNVFVENASDNSTLARPIDFEYRSDSGFYDTGIQGNLNIATDIQRVTSYINTVRDTSSLFGDYISNIESIKYVLGNIQQDLLIPDRFNDNHVAGTDLDDKFQTSDGNDTIEGRGGNDQLEGGLGNDDIQGGFGVDWLSGDDGDDTLDGGSGYDYLDGGPGSDFISGGTGNDGLRGGDGNDTILGGDGDDWIDGEGGDDLISAGAGNDIVGYAVFPHILNIGIDTIDGGDGDDWLIISDYYSEESIELDLTGAVTAEGSL